ncbi:hypothetical protein HHK36_004857 [Tetracentron sinense]|uniref:Uncharacterized protein n=1 Tax=Tetracentron sinense TaxID=13715 RepID=A0A834ZPD1_TETSI|nr:hypothetical protein HHK36_004857 [Tetracentron sinense]
MKNRIRKKPSIPNGTRKKARLSLDEDPFFNHNSKRKRKNDADDGIIDSDEDEDGMVSQAKNNGEEESEVAVETADEKRQRVAKEYLEKIRDMAKRDQEDEDREDGGETDEDEKSGMRDSLVAGMLQQEQLEESGRIRRLIASRVQRPETIDEFRVLVKHRQSVTAVALADDDSKGFSASKDGTIIHWDVESGKGEKYAWPNKDILSSHGARDPQSPHMKWSKHILALDVSSDGRYLATGGLDRHVHLWDTRTREHIQAFPGHRGPVSCLTFRQGTSQLISGSFDRTIKLWNAEDRAYMDTLFGHQSEVLTIDCLRKERMLTVGRDRTMHLWKVKVIEEDEEDTEELLAASSADDEDEESNEEAVRGETEVQYISESEGDDDPSSSTGEESEAARGSFIMRPLEEAPRTPIHDIARISSFFEGVPSHPIDGVLQNLQEFCSGSEVVGQPLCIPMDSLSGIMGENITGLEEDMAVLANEFVDIKGSTQAVPSSNPSLTIPLLQVSSMPFQQSLPAPSLPLPSKPILVHQGTTSIVVQESEWSSATPSATTIIGDYKCLDELFASHEFRERLVAAEQEKEQHTSTIEMLDKIEKDVAETRKDQASRGGVEDAEVAFLTCIAARRPSSNIRDRTILSYVFAICLCIILAEGTALQLVPEESQLVFRAPASSLECGCFISNDEFLSGSDDGSIELWSMLRKKPAYIVKNAHALVAPHEKLEIKDNGRISDGSIESGNLKPENYCSSVHSWVSSVTVCGSSDLAASGAGNGSVCLWAIESNTKSIRPLFNLPVIGFVNSLAFAKSGRFLVAGVGQRNVSEESTAVREVCCKLPGRPEEPRLGRWGRIPAAQNGVVLHPLKLSEEGVTRHF